MVAAPGSGAQRQQHGIEVLMESKCWSREYPRQMRAPAKAMTGSPTRPDEQAISLDLPTVYPRQAGRYCKPGGQQDAETVEALL
jgi:hypothetical protein